MRRDRKRFKGMKKAFIWAALMLIAKEAAKSVSKSLVNEAGKMTLKSVAKGAAKEVGKMAIGNAKANAEEASSDVSGLQLFESLNAFLGKKDVGGGGGGEAVDVKDSLSKTPEGIAQSAAKATSVAPKLATAKQNIWQGLGNSLIGKETDLSGSSNAAYVGDTIGDFVRKNALKLSPTDNDPNQAQAALNAQLDTQIKQQKAAEGSDPVMQDYRVLRNEALRMKNSGQVSPQKQKEFNLRLLKNAQDQAKTLMGGSMMVGIDPTQNKQYKALTQKIYLKLQKEINDGGDVPVFDENEDFDPSGFGSININAGE